MLNKATIIGYLGADPETRYMPSGTAVTNFRVATTEKWKDKQSGEKQERTEWHSISMFGRVAEIAADYLRKGSLVYIEGKLRTRKWQDKQGADRYTTEIIGDELKMLGGTRAEGAPKRGQLPANERTAETGAPAASEPASKDFDDDIPF